MKEYIVKIPEAEVEAVSHVLEKFGAEMIPVQTKNKIKKTPKPPQKKTTKKKIDHTYLFGKWKDFDIDAKKLREQSW